MKGLIVDGDSSLRLADDIPEPRLQDYTAVVKTVACGICNGTDVKLREGHLRNFSTYPAVLGHEGVGRVVEVGSKVRNFKVGDLVLRSSLDDMAPKYYSLWGSFAEYGRVVDYRAQNEDGVPGDIGCISQQVIPHGIDPVDGVMIITLKEVYSAMKRLGISSGAKVAIVGCGPVGLAMVRFCKLMGASFVALSGHHEERLAVARKLGADVAVNSKTCDFVSELKKQCPEPLDFFIDAVGRCAVISQGMGLVRDDGVIGVYGIGLETDRGIDWNRGPYNWKLHSIQWPIPPLEAAIHNEVVGSILNKQIDLKDFVTHRMPVEEFETGFGLVQRRQGLKIALCFE